MEPIRKKAKITGHFRVALKPHDVNAQRNFKVRKNHEIGKENIEVITLDENDDDQNQSAGCEDNNQIIPKRLLVVDKQAVNQQEHERRASKENKVIKEKEAVNDHVVVRGKEDARAEVNVDVEETEEEEEEENNNNSINNNDQKSGAINKYFAPPGIKPHIIDHDQAVLEDIRCEPYYAWDSFQYDKDQERKFQNLNYFNDRLMGHDVTPHKRAELVEWLVELQNLFELDHEPLYMSVKLVDQFLMRKFVPHENLHLLFMTSLLISAKFDERLPPLQVSDLIHAARVKFGIRYTKKQLVCLEVDILNTLDFNIRFPLSYGFLRRYARCTRSDRTTLNLARYILESSLLEYNMIEELESKLAAGSLLLALRMLHHNSHKGETWTKTAEFYTGYRKEELTSLSLRLNDIIFRLSKKNSAIRKKYSHDCFMEVARIPPLPRPEYSLGGF